MAECHICTLDASGTKCYACGEDVCKTCSSNVRGYCGKVHRVRMCERCIEDYERTRNRDKQSPLRLDKHQ